MIFLQVNQPFHFFQGIWRPTETRHFRPSYFKYRAFEDEFALNLLNPGEIYLQNPLKFEDHEDCQIALPYSRLSLEQARIIGRRHRHDPEALSMTDQEYDQHIIRVHNRTVSGGEDGDRAIVRANAGSIGVFCMTRNWDNLYLWNNYTNNRTGFCVEFNATKFFDYISRLGLGLYPDDVTYSDDPLEIDLTEDENRTWLKLMSTKKEVWRPEEETRFITYGINDDQRTVPLEDGIIQSVTLGENVLHENVNLIKSTLRQRYDRGLVHEILIYKIYMQDGRFNKERILP